MHLVAVQPIEVDILGMTKGKKFTLRFEEVGIKDVPLVGGKNASLGEMIRELGKKGIRVPTGFVVTASAYRHFLAETGLKKQIRDTLKGLDTKNLRDLASRGRIIRDAVKGAEIPGVLVREIASEYRKFSRKFSKGKTDAVDVAVRSSATAEDLPGASFAGEHETFLNIRGDTEVVKAVQAAMASLFTDRAISYRVDKGFDHFKVALSVGVQKMVRSDKGCSGVMFTLDTESGFKDVVLINGAWGLGELIVQGEVTPDEFLVWKSAIGKSRNPVISKKLGVKNRKFVYRAEHGTTIRNIRLAQTTDKEKASFALDDAEILLLAKWGAMIEEHYTKKNRKWTPMDMEWAKDGASGELFIVQARPETIHAERDYTKVKEYLLEKAGPVITKGASVGVSIASGRARVILSASGINSFQKGEVLVTDMTDPDWEPIMKIASAIVTNKGGRTSHAAIVSRELGIPCVVGTENATRKIKTGDLVTVDVSGAEGIVYEGAVPFKVVTHDVKKLKRPKTKIMMNIATPDTAFEKSFLPNDGVGLAREEFIIASEIGVHPMALIEFQKVKERIPALARAIEKRSLGYKDKKEFYTDKLAYGIAKIGLAFHPKKVIVRFSDFKTNEYRTLLGGDLYELREENPMIGWRGASRYYHPEFEPAFALECAAIKKVREEMGLTNVVVMIPFCRTVEEGKKVLAVMARYGLKKTKDFHVYVMCEIPSNILLADEFLEVFDGMSIGSNDLTQLTLGIDRDGNERIRGISNERDEAVKRLISQVIKIAKKRKKYIGICGQGPSDMPDFAEFLVKEGIESMSLNPDTVVKTTERIFKAEKKRR